MLSLPHDKAFPEYYVPFKKYEYSEKIHAERLYAMMLKMIHQGETIHEMCPAAKESNAENQPNIMWELFSTYPCSICINFLNLQRNWCPCYLLGTDRAIERTIEQLYEKHYISLDCRNEFMYKLVNIEE